jgi:sec-independent protein translocase protein TatB
MGDITPVKILIVAVIALVVLGPDKLPEMMRKAGKAWADFRSFRETMTNQVRDTVGDVPGFSELTKLTRMTNVGIKSTIASSVTAAMSPSATSTSPATSAVGSPAVATRPATSFQPTAELSAVGASRPELTARPQVAAQPTFGVGDRPGATTPGAAEPVFVADDPSFN